jgi:NitT/TauT family transport system permease protein
MKLRFKLREYIYSFIIITAIWYLASIILKIPVIPSPVSVYGNIFSMAGGQIWIHVLYSLFRIFSGVFISLIVGVALGFFMGYNSTVDKYLSPLVYFTYPIPKLALLPIVMLIFGLGEASKIIMVVMIIIFQVIISSRDAVKAIPREMYYSLESLGASRYQTFKELIIPAAMPEVLTATRLAMGTAVSILFFTETFGTEYGMGYFIMDAWMRVSYVEMYSGIVILSIMGFLIFILIDLLENCICKWR